VKSVAASQKYNRVVLATALVISSPFLVWLGWAKISDKPASVNSGFSIIGQAIGTSLNAIQPPARTVPLIHATLADLKDTFIFTRFAFVPGSEWIYVQQANAKSGEGSLIDISGRWGAQPGYSDPNFSGDTASGLFPARKGEVWGFINIRGAWVIAPQYNQVGEFHNGVSLVYVRDSKGYRACLIDTEGKPLGAALPDANALVSVSRDMLITRNAWFKRNADGTLTQATPAYSSFAPFDSQSVIGLRDGKAMLLDHSGNPVSTEQFEQVLAPVKGKAAAAQNGKWGVIDVRGNWLVAPQFESLGIREDGTLVTSQQGKLLTLDGSGKPLPEEKVRPIASPTEDLTAACQELRCGYTDRTGNWVIAPQFDNAFAFSEGVARIVKNGLVAYIDRSGRFLTPEPPANAAAPWLWRPDSMRDGNSNNGGVVFGYIDRSGKFIISPVFSRLGDFSENLAPAQSSSGAFGYIGPDGYWIIPPVFNEAGNFTEGLAAVRGSRAMLGNFGYIDTQGHIQITLSGEFNAAGNFKNGLAKLSNYGGRAVLIDKSGNQVQPGAAKANPPEASSLQRLSLNGSKWGYADAQDRFVIAPQFDEAGDFSGDYAAVKRDGKWGFIDRSGAIVVKPAYDEVGQFSEGLVRVKQGERWTYIDIKGQPILVDDVVVAGDFHDGRAKVGIDLYAAKKRIAGVDATVNTDKLPDFTHGFPVMLSEGSDMKHGIAFIKLSRGGYYDNYSYRYAMLNKQGELIFPRLNLTPATTDKAK
jgi:hypothetical protein